MHVKLHHRTSYWQENLSDDVTDSNPFISSNFLNSIILQLVIALIYNHSNYDGMQGNFLNCQFLDRGYISNFLEDPI
jgi:hypothetical protein